MPLKYTTVDDVNRQLDGRLQIGGNATTLGASIVTPEIVLQIGEQIEDWIDGILRKRYKLPLANIHPTLASIAEAGIACRLLQQYYVGQAPAENVPADSGVCRDYYAKLKLLEKIALPNETLIERSPETVGFQWASIQAGIRNAPSQTVEW
ncbi:MAG: phage protein Gp36 family protein [Cyanobacteria bacterium P01_C01_bin.120]